MTPIESVTHPPVLHEADMSAFDLGQGRFALAYNFVSSFKYLLSESAAQAHLRCVHAALQPGGVYILGLHVVDYAYHATGGERERWRERRDGIVVEAKILSSAPDPMTCLEHVEAYLTVSQDTTTTTAEKRSDAPAAAITRETAPASSLTNNGDNIAAHTTLSPATEPGVAVTETHADVETLTALSASDDTKRLVCRFDMRTYDVEELFSLVADCGAPFEVAGTYDFYYKPSDPRTNTDQLAVILALRRPVDDGAAKA